MNVFGKHWWLPSESREVHSLSQKELLNVAGWREWAVTHERSPASSFLEEELSLLGLYKYPLSWNSTTW